MKSKVNLQTGSSLSTYSGKQDPRGKTNSYLKNYKDKKDNPKMPISVYNKTKITNLKQP